MAIQPEIIGQLLARLIAGDPLTPEEEATLQNWACSSDENLATYKELIQDEFPYLTAFGHTPPDAAESWHVIASRQEGSGTPMAAMRHRGRTITLALGMAAAAFLYFVIRAWWGPAITPSIDYTQQPLSSIPPHQTWLVVSNGQRLVLDSIPAGQLATTAKAPVEKIAQGTLQYKVSPSPLMNRVVTGTGSLYHMILSDGSEVWLNAESSLRFPLSFSDSERKVELQGQAYFQVKADPARPFLVKTSPLVPGDTGLTIRVLGTRFDCRVYPGDTTALTTLLEGAIHISQQGRGITMRGAQSAHYSAVNRHIRLGPVVDYFDWRDSLQFDFTAARLYVVMDQLARWYHVRIVCPDRLLKFWKITASLKKSQPLEDILEAFASGMKIKYHRSGDTVFIKGSLPK